MPDMIDDTLGSPAFVFNQQNGDTWHSKGVPVDGAMTVDDIFERCPQLDFPVDKVPMLAQTEGGATTVPGWSVVVRTDTDAAFGPVRSSYHTFQNREGFAFGDAVRGESGADWDTAGSLYEGRLVFGQLILGENFKIPTDPSEWLNRLLVWWGHDGRHALKAKRTKVRVVCANTHSQAVNGIGAEFSVRHTTNMAAHVEQARKALELVAVHDEAFVAVMTDLTKRKMSIADLAAFTESLFPLSPDVEHGYKTEAAREAVASLFRGSPTLDGVKPTAYRLFQATVEYADHYRAYRTKAGDISDARAESILDGAASALKDRALALLS